MYFCHSIARDRTKRVTKAINNESEAAKQEYSFMQKALAFSVHVFTATGVITAILAIIAISNAAIPGADHGNHMRWAMLWLFLAQVIDGVDGAFARLFKAREVLPDWDGKAIDYVIDFATYAIIPAFFLYQSGILPQQWAFPAICLLLMVSALYYGKEGMVSNDYHFIGFPVMWNMTAFYMYFITELPPYVNLAVIVIVSIMHFIPVKYPYPSRTKEFQIPNVFFAVVFVIVNVWILFNYPIKHPWLQWMSIGCLAYYALVSAYYTATYGKAEQKISSSPS